jgi:glutamate racemase
LVQPIGIFDSGIGGLSVLKALRTELPNEHFIYIADSGHAPYGERDDAHVIQRSLKIAAYLTGRNIKSLVVACNTATAAAIDVLRATYPTLPIVGVEPALKPAVAASSTRHIAVMATRSTLGSARFAALMAAHSSQANFVLLPCDGLAEAIEKAALDSDASKVIAACARILGSTATFDGQKEYFQTEKAVDTVVLGCTHYPFAAQYITGLLGPGVKLLDTGAAVALQTRRLLAGNLSAQPIQHIEWFSTGPPGTLQTAAQAWMGLKADTRMLSI